MKKCKNCNSDIFDNEKICMHCGAVQENNNNDKKKFVICIGIILIIAILYVAYNYKLSEQTETNSFKEESNEEVENNNNNNENNLYDNNYEDEKTDDNYYNSSYDTSNFFHISIDDLNKTLNQKDNQKYFVLAASPYCSHCLEFVPKVNRSLEDYEYAIEYIDMSKVSTNDVNTIRQKRGFSSFGSTPIVYVVQNGIAIDSSIGNVDYYNYLNFLEKHGVQKKDNSDEIIIESVK
ncbi:MAG: thioredoxin family protein [Bacilli bacterium]|nr:thioredoxin family protein [Bacilli bacterium]